MPHSDEAERLVLGTVMNEKNALPFVREMLPVEAFYQDKHREIYRSIIDVADKGNFPDIVMVMEELLRKKSTISPYELTNCQDAPRHTWNNMSPWSLINTNAGSFLR